MTGNRRNRPGDHVNASDAGTVGAGSNKLNFTEIAQANTAALTRAINTHVPGELQKVHPRELLLDSDFSPQALLDAVVAADRGYLDTLVHLLIEKRIGLVAFYENLLHPVLAQIDQMWRTDEMNFVNVELATIRLQMMCNRFAERHAARVQPNPDAKRMLLARGKGDQHMLGLSIVDVFFRENGWQVEGGSTLEIDRDFFDRVSGNYYDVVGISVGTSHAESIAHTISQIKVRSLNRNVKIALGGAAINTHRQAFEAVGADLLTTDVRTMVDETAQILETAAS